MSRSDRGEPEGSYHQLGEFLERLARLPARRDAQGDEARIHQPVGRAVRAELTLATYQYRPVGAPKPVAPK